MAWLIAIISFLSSTFVAALASHYFAHKLWYQEHSLKKLEELYDAFHLYAAYWQRLLNTGNEYRNASPTNRGKGDVTNEAAAEKCIRKLINLYFVRLRGPLGKAEELVESYKQLRTDEHGDATFRVISRRNAFETATAEMEKAIFEEGERIRQNPIIRAWRRFAGFWQSQCEQC